MSSYRGAHPAIGALDVCPLVWLDPADRDAARTEAIAVAAQIGGLGVPVFLYGELAATRPGRARLLPQRRPLRALAADGVGRAAARLRPDAPHPRGGATLVTARPPLAAFNVELDSGDLEVARAVAAGLRESGGGLPGVRAIGLVLAAVAARSRPTSTTRWRCRWRAVVEAVRELAAPLGARPLEAELVGLIPAAALADYPADVPMRGFDPALHVIERRLAALTDLDSRHGSDEEKAPPQAPGHSGRPHRHQGPRRAPAQPRGGQGPGPLQTRQPAGRKPICRRPGATRRSAASSPLSSSRCCWS